MGEPEMLREQELQPEVDFYGMCLQDAESAQLAYPGGRVMDEGVFVTAHPGRVDIESAGHTHTAAMTAQVWDGEPPADTGRVWDLRADTVIHSGTGVLQVWAVAYGPIPDEIELGDPGADWHVRVYCTGREDVARIVEDEGIAEGAEQYLIQFWPCQA
ncbi:MULTISPECIES: hypothetical protein [Streptomyces]|uniref:Uncharacterized protein n=1 Tax=Streptomyces demainii TaxID=588122 RepID=A0ABT9KJW8_9ACTN|nr:hypothetical protein [Streptomyces demainii]MDP9607852.1 hypothetical protein [Streptomyces demainii]